MHDDPRRTREARTVEAMIRLYCRDHHDDSRADGADLCDDCAALLDHALHKLDRCPFGGAKPTCDVCAVHCYSPAMREQVRTVMLYAGPRMLRHHPWMAIRHLVDRRRPAPELRRRRPAGEERPPTDPAPSTAPSSDDDGAR